MMSHTDGRSDSDSEVEVTEAAEDDHRDDDTEPFEHYMRREMKNVKGALEEVEQRSKDADLRSQDHERTLYGHEDSRRRLSEPGLVQVVSELASAFKDVKAVARAGWAMLGLVGFSTAISLFSLFNG